MATDLILLFTSLVVTYFAKAQWTTGYLQLENSQMAAGEYNGTIFIFGGIDYQFALTEYDSTNNSIVSTLVNSFNTPIYGEGQYYSQFNDILYMINVIGESINAYDFTTDTFFTNYLNINFPYDVNYQSCLVASDTELYIVGGNNLNPLDIVQILNIAEQSWKIVTMQEKRSSLSCIISSWNDLYVIGGETELDFSNTIEYISVDNIDTGFWYYTNGNLYTPLKATRSVLFGNNIYIIGGRDIDNNYPNVVHVMDSITKSVSWDASMAYGVASAATIIVGKVLYVFGGTISGTSTNTNSSQYITIFTNDPSMSPTTPPSVQVFDTTSPPSETITAATTSTTLAITKSLQEIIYEETITNTQDFAFSAVIILMSVFILFALMDCVYVNCNLKTDQYNGKVHLRMSLRVTDLFTDIVLAYIITYEAFYSRDVKYLILSTASILSLVIPYLINVVYMFKIPKFKSINHARPTLWFSKYMFFYVLCVLITSDAYTASLFISSNIFGLDLFHAGLNQIQFNKIKSIKTVNTLTESLPQIVIQAIYSYINGLEELIVISLALSAISNITSVASWFLTNQVNKKYDLIQYGLNVTIKSMKSSRESNQSMPQQSKHEILQIAKYRGFTKRLRNKICLTLGIEISEIQIFSVDMNDDGCTINIVHFVVKTNDTKKSREFILRLYQNKFVDIAQRIMEVFHIDSDVETRLVNMLANTDDNFSSDLQKLKSLSSIDLEMIRSDNP